MTDMVPLPPVVPIVPEVGSVVDSGAATVDAVLAARARVDGEFIAGLILAGQLDTVGSPRKLPLDLWPQSDPVLQELVQEVWNRALVVGVRAGRFMGTPRFYRDKLATLQGQLEEAGHVAMAGALDAPLAVAQRAPEWHPVDGEIEREHP